MEKIINKMLERINFKIRYAQENFTEWNAAHERRMAEINGMVDMLSIVTRKDYIITEKGLKEIVNLKAFMETDIYLCADLLEIIDKNGEEMDDIIPDDMTQEQLQNINVLDYRMSETQTGLLCIWVDI